MNETLPVYLNGRYLSQRITGVQRHAAELVSAIDRRLRNGHHQELQVTLLTPPNARNESRLGGIPVKRVGRLTGQAWEQLELPWHARAGVLMSFGNMAPLVHSRQVITLHDAGVYAFPSSYSMAFRLWYRLLFPQLGRRAVTVVTDSAFSRDELVRYLGLSADRIEVVHCGCEHVLAQPSDPGILERAGLQSRRFVLASGGYVPRKNLAVLERAATLLGRDAPAIAVVGGSNARVFGRSANTRTATFLGHVSDAELRALYENAICLVFPSLYEGFGLPPLEAMACGCPVVVARTSALPEVCGDAARYVSPHDAAGIAAEVQALLHDQRRHDALCAAGHARAKRFTWDQAAAKTMEIATRLAVPACAPRR